MVLMNTFIRKLFINKDNIDWGFGQKDFKNFYQQYDQRRSKNFCETFPELEDWYNEL